MNKDFILSIIVFFVAINSIHAQELRMRRPRRLGRTVTASMQKTEAKSELLEPALSLEAAAELAKKNDPRGYYQLAIHASKVQTWGREDGFDSNQYSAYILQKAVDAGYLNAMFVAVLAEDSHTEDCVESFRETEHPMALLEKYTGNRWMGWTGDRKSLSESNDVAAIRRKYENLVALGVSQATNAIAILELRSGKAMEAEKRREIRQKTESNKKNADDITVECLKSIIDLPPVQKKQSAEEKRIRVAKDAEAIYISLVDRQEVHWSTNCNSKLHLKVGRDGLGFKFRVLEFAEDGRLISVLPAQQ